MTSVSGMNWLYTNIWVEVFETHKDQITVNAALRAENIRKAKYLHEFDREVQCATWGYPTEGAYYRDASSADSVLAIRIPVFCIHARDDPIAVDEAVPYEEIMQNPFVVMCATSGGGHLSWFELGGGRWHAKPVSLLQLAKGSDDEYVTNVWAGCRISECDGEGCRLFQDCGAEPSRCRSAWWT